MIHRRAKMSPIGLDVGSTRVKAVQVQLGATGPRVYRVASLPRLKCGQPLEAGECVRLSEVLRRKGFAGDRVVTCVPRGQLLSNVMELPPASSGAPLDQIARQELARASKCEPTGIELAWWALPGGARAAEGTHAMAVGCRHEDALALIDVLAAADLDVTVLDAPMTALARATAPMLGDPAELAGILDIGHSAAALIITLGRTVVYERELSESGVGRLLASVTARLGIASDDAEVLLRGVGCLEVGREPDQPSRRRSDLDDVNADISAMTRSHADALAAEVRLSAAYAMRRFDAAMSRMLLTGAGAALPGVAEHLGPQTGVLCRVVRLSDVCGADSAASADDAGPEHVLALGLALHLDKEPAA